MGEISVTTRSIKQESQVISSTRVLRQLGWGGIIKYPATSLTCYEKSLNWKGV